jgi:hypothetical protein
MTSRLLHCVSLIAAVASVLPATLAAAQQATPAPASGDCMYNPKNEPPVSVANGETKTYHSMEMQGQMGMQGKMGMQGPAYVLTCKEGKLTVTPQ